MSRFTFRRTGTQSSNRLADTLREPTAIPAPGVISSTPPPLRVQITSQATRTQLAIYVNGFVTPNPTRAQITSQATRAAIQ